MMRALLMVLVFSSCVENRNVAITFGEEGEGLDGFMCRDADGGQLLSRVAEDRRGSLVLDFVTLGGVPGCRTGQMIKWCKTHKCAPIPSKRTCVGVKYPAPEENRGVLREALRTTMRESEAGVANTPDEFVLVRVVGTTQSCESLEQNASGELPAFDKTQLVGCAYSCPVLLDYAEQDVYIGFETFQDRCEQGVKTCSDGELHWEP